MDAPSGKDRNRLVPSEDSGFPAPLENLLSKVSIFSENSKDLIEIRRIEDRFMRLQENSEGSCEAYRLGNLRATRRKPLSLLLCSG